MEKYYIKKNIIGFIVGLILCTGTFVYAAVTFPSNEVTYDNTESGLSSTNVKGAIDELYTECTTVPAGEQIIENAGLEKDEYECRYFFTGGNPNNYITFNNEKAGWRIISVECDGRIKIMRDSSIGNQRWDTANGSNWARPASLNTYLNGTYYNVLNSATRNQIVASNFSIGIITWENNNLSMQVNSENSKLWKGNIALPTVSEYIRTNNNKNNCGTYALYNDNFRTCVNTGWMDNNDYWWTLSPNSDHNIEASFVATYGGIGIGTVLGYDEGNAVRPAVYLSSSVKLSGSGTSSNPYTIS